MAGTPQNVHLRKIEEDQSIDGIETIDDTIRNERGRKWFVSQAVSPVLDQGFYDPHRGRYRLGPEARDTEGVVISTSSVSAATYTLTVPDGQVFQILGAAASNTARNTPFRADFSLDGGTTYFPLPGAQDGSNIIGGAQYGVNVPQPFTLTGSGANVIIRCVCVTFVAADPVRYTILHRRLR